MIIKKYCPVLVLGICLTLLNLVYAAESLEELLWGPELEIITATKLREHPLETPANVIVITEEMIKERGYLDLKDVFNDLPGFDVSTNIYGEFSTLVMNRGIGGNNKLVLLLNGEKINNPDGKQFSYGNNVPLGNVQKIEIVYGPASAVYGPDAFGVINIITKSPEEIDGTDLHISAGEFGTYNNWLLTGKMLNDDIGYSLFIRSFITDGQDLSAEYDRLSFIKDYYPNVRGIRAEYEDPVEDYNVDLTFKIKDVSLNFYRSNYHEQLAKALIPEHYVYNEEAYWGHTVDRLSLKHNYSLENLNLNSSVSFMEYETDPDMNWYYLDVADNSTLKVHQYGKINSLKFETAGDYTFESDINFLAGISLEDITGMAIGDVVGEPFDRDNLLYMTNPYNTQYPQAALSSQNYGIFSQLKYPFKDNIYLTLGARYDYNTIYEETINPRAGVVYRRNPAQVFKLLYGSAHIFPSYFHRYETWFTADYGHIPNPDLQPEKMKTVEFNWTQDWSDNLITNMSVYRNRVEDLIVRRGYGTISLPEHWGSPTPYVEWNDNSGELTSYGLDSRLDYIINEHLKGYFNYSYLDGHTDHPEEIYAGEEFDLFKTSEHKIMAGLTWKPTSKLSISPRLRWVNDIVTRPENAKYGTDNPYSGSHERMPGYTVTDLNIVYRCTEKIDISLLVNNLLNEKYCTAGVASESSVYLPEVPQDLRRILFAVTCHF